jgi:hypothetical protein
VNEPKEDLSSDWTYIYKFIFPIFWIGGFGIGTISMWSSPNNGIPLSDRFTFLAAWLLGSAYIYWTCIRLKAVWIDDNFLYISNTRKRCQVPLAQITKVTEWRWDNAHPVTVHFAQPTEFGASIVFMPKVRMFGFWSSHPVVARIREAAKLSSIHPI